MAEPDAIDRITRTRLVSAVRSQMTDIILEHEDAIITNLISEYQGGTLGENRAFGAIGELTSLRRLLQSIESEAKKAIYGEEPRKVTGS